MKRVLCLSIMIFAAVSVFAQNSRVKFVKGNIAEKTATVREASEKDAAWVSENAIKFCLENKEILGNDRELDALAVAAILSYTPESVRKLSHEKQNWLTESFISLFTRFNKSSTVLIAVVSKTVALKDTVEPAPFTALLNSYLKTVEVKSADSGVFKACVNALETIGNNESFKILYSFLNDNSYSYYKNEIEKTAVALIPLAMDELLLVIKGSDMAKMASVFELVQKNSQISQKNVCEVSEKVLSESILIADNSSFSAGDLKLQLEALSILAENKWTRASDTALSFFAFAKNAYEKHNINDEQFKTVINSLRYIAPIDAVNPLISYLEELNNKMERGENVSSEISLVVINTLGAIGDKSAFDSLLSVTYLNYEESVLTAARDALSGLRWQ